MKQETLAGLIGISSTALSHIENGKTDISVTRIEQIANSLGLSFYDILTFPNQIVSEHNGPNYFWSRNHSSSSIIDNTLMDSLSSLANTLAKLAAGVPKDGNSQ
jgi:transcriptional regulator with XRE-family HTH domain